MGDCSGNFMRPSCFGKDVYEKIVSQSLSTRMASYLSKYIISGWKISKLGLGYEES